MGDVRPEIIDDWARIFFRADSVPSYPSKRERIQMNPTHQNPAYDERLAYPINEIPRITGVGRTSVYGAISAKKLRAVKHGRRTLVLVEDLKQWLAGLPAMNPETKK
jgi:excisionase family DNA binding protein